MLPLCSAAPSYSSCFQWHISCHVGTRNPFQKAIQHRSTVEERHFLCIHDGIQCQEPSFKLHATKYMDSLVFEKPDASYDSFIFSPYRNDFDDIVREFSEEYFDNEPQDQTYSAKEAFGLYPVSGDLPGPETVGGKFGAVENEASISLAEQLSSSYIELPSAASPSGDGMPGLSDAVGRNSAFLSASRSFGSSMGTGTMTGSAPEGLLSVSNSFELTNKAVTSPQESIQNFLSGISESVNKAEDAAKKAYDSVLFFFSESVESVRSSFDSAVNGLLSSVYNTKEQAGNELTGLSSEFRGSIYKAGSIAVDILRQTISLVEDSLSNVAMFIVYSYASTKSSLPLDVRNALDISEEKIKEILSPAGSSLQQAYNIIEGFERNLGLDPNDPIVPFALLLGSTIFIGISYWRLNYGGYSGDLSPELTLELLKNEKNVVLIDVRPEALRERDGVPDLRQAARSKYASVVFPEIDVSVKKQLKGGRAIENVLVAAVIRNLKIVQDGSKVVVMDDSDTRSKAIARSLKYLGVKKPFLLRGGFQSWVKKGLRIKKLKPETTLTVLNEEAEAILENIRPTPALITVYGLLTSAAVLILGTQVSTRRQLSARLKISGKKSQLFHACFRLTSPADFNAEWEKTLQIIGIIGLGQTLYQRFASYEDSEGFKQDVRLLLSPVRLGAEAFTWAAQKIKPNKIGLPVSPSSSAVQNRVLQAAAKHEAKPSDSDETGELVTPASENLDLSEV